MDTYLTPPRSRVKRTGDITIMSTRDSFLSRRDELTIGGLSATATAALIAIIVIIPIISLMAYGCHRTHSRRETSISEDITKASDSDSDREVYAEQDTSSLPLYRQTGT